MKFGRNKSALKSRREGAIKRLSSQLEAGTKPEKPIAMITLATTGAHLLSLSDSDRKRIQKEIDILKSRI